MDLEPISVPVRMEFLTDLLGSAPMNKELFLKYQDTKKVKARKHQPPEEIALQESGPVEVDTIPEMEDHLTGFPRDPVTGELFLYNYVVKGFLKNAAACVPLPADHVAQNPKAKLKLETQIIRWCFVRPRQLFLGVTAPTDILERPLRAMTMQGPRVTLAASERMQVEGIATPALSVACEVVILPGYHVLTPAAILDLLAYGEYQGLGQWKTGGYGQFRVV